MEWLYGIIASILLAGITTAVLAIRKSGKDDVLAEQAKEKADVAEKRLDIANRPDSNVVDILQRMRNEKL